MDSDLCAVTCPQMILRHDDRNDRELFSQLSVATSVLPLKSTPDSRLTPRLSRCVNPSDDPSFIALAHYDASRVSSSIRLTQALFLSTTCRHPTHPPSALNPTRALPSTATISSPLPLQSSQTHSRCLAHRS